NNEDIFGCQAIVNEFDEVEGFNEHLLIGATTLSLDEVLREIHATGGLAIASHIDRPSFSVTSQLGFIDSNMLFDALEIMSSAEVNTKWQGSDKFPVIRSSDAHSIDDIGSKTTTIIMSSPSIFELSMAFKKQLRRCVKG
ncbi:MAG: histidinol-phosphatase, partial [Deltaproteobacteria bacterium]